MKHKGIIMKKLLAETSMLLLKTQNYHWNVKGPMFQALHTLFETQYNELFLAVDEIAERIKANNEWAPGTYKEYLVLSEIEEVNPQKAEEMIKDLIKANQKVAETASNLAQTVSNAVDEDLAIRRQEVHEKAIWMLKSLLE